MTCSLGTLNAGASTTVTIIIIPKVPGIITNIAVVTSTEAGPVQAVTITLVCESLGQLGFALAVLVMLLKKYCD